MSADAAQDDRKKWQLFHWEDSWAIRMHPATVTIHIASERSTSQHSVTERLILDYTIYRILHKAFLKESLFSKHLFIYDQFARLYKVKSNNKSQNQTIWRWNTSIESNVKINFKVTVRPLKNETNPKKDNLNFLHYQSSNSIARLKKIKYSESLCYGRICLLLNLWNWRHN